MDLWSLPKDLDSALSDNFQIIEEKDKGKLTEDYAHMWPLSKFVAQI